MLDVGNQLYQVCRKRGYTVAELATLADMNPAHLRGIFTGKYPYPQNATIEKLARILEVDVRVVVKDVRYG